jgi:hypothetical protein
VAKLAVGGAIETAGAIGQTALKAVKDMLVGVVEGVRDVANAAMVKGEEKTLTVKPKPAPPKK